MERITEKIGHVTRFKKFVDGRPLDMNTVINHLAAYEDAEEQCLLMQLPCKIGDTVYTPFEADDGWSISEDRIVEVGTRGFWESNSPGCHTDRMDEFVPWDEIGKSVFFSREEAKAALNALQRHEIKP